MNKHIILTADIVLFFVCFLFTVGCSKTESTVYHNEPFEDIYSDAIVNNTPFCIVLVDSTRSVSKEYLAHLQEYYKDLTEKAIYNIVDINSEEDEWYKKWLLPVSIPLTCVFSPDGVLIDLIPGVSKETFL